MFLGLTYTQEEYQQAKKKRHNEKREKRFNKIRESKK